MLFTESEKKTVQLTELFITRPFLYLFPLRPILVVRGGWERTEKRCQNGCGDHKWCILETLITKEDQCHDKLMYDPIDVIFHSTVECIVVDSLWTQRFVVGLDNQMYRDQSWALALYFQVRSPLSAKFLPMDCYRSIAHFSDFKVRSSLIRSKKTSVSLLEKSAKMLYRSRANRSKFDFVSLLVALCSFS